MGYSCQILMKCKKNVYYILTLIGMDKLSYFQKELFLLQTLQFELTD